MKRRPSLFTSNRGSVLVTTVVFSGVALLMVASILQWSLTERRLNHRHELRIEARNAAEAAAEFGFAQVQFKMEGRTSFPANALDPNGADALSPIPPTFAADTSDKAVAFRSLFAGTNVDPDSIEVLGGVARDITDEGSATFYVDPNDPNNQFDPLKGKRIFRRDVQILAKATVKPMSGPPITAHVVETLAMREVPLFSHAIFYNMDLELAPGADMTIFGPVHSNGNMWVTGQNNNGTTLDFVGPVTIAGGLFFGYETHPKMANGSSESTTNEPIRFINRAGARIDLRSSNGIWRDHKMGQANESSDTRDAFREFTSQTYNGNLQTGVHGIGNYKPVAFDEYKKDTTPYNGVDESVNSGRAIIERPLAPHEPGYNPEIEEQKYSRKSGLYITVNPSNVSRTGRKPDGTTVTVPAGEYRAYRRDGTRVYLPGDPNHPTTAARNARPVIKIKQDQMYDLRRVQNDYDPSKPRSSSNRYAPKKLDIIEVDMTALKLAVDKTVNGLTQSTIYPYDDPSDRDNQSTYRASSSTTVNLSDANLIANYGDANWNGAVYIESIDAEANDRRDSGVRVINARGKVAGRAISNPNDPGLTLATNDAMYLLGHFNADGNIPNASNASRYAENANEVPAALAADAITILSQPKFSSTSLSANQTQGWNDSLSQAVTSTSSHSTSWQTSNPSGSNQRDGWRGDTSNNSMRPNRNPLENTPYSGPTSGRPNAQSTKFQGADTEISAALLTGITPSNKNGSNQYSGGAHNFPRLLEHWNGDLVIRGSMVALFESRVATEPWSIRVYNAPGRFWGFHDMFARGIYPPQTPRIRTYRRVDFRDVTATEYQELVNNLPW